MIPTISLTSAITVHQANTPDLGLGELHHRCTGIHEFANTSPLFGSELFSLTGSCGVSACGGNVARMPSYLPTLEGCNVR